MEKAVSKILGEIHEDGEGFYALWKGVRLYSVFQGVYGLAQRRPVGFEALIRGRKADGKILTPGEILAGASGLEDLVTMDRLFRAIHLHNFVRFRTRGVWVFLNVHPEVAIHGRKYGAFFGHLLSYLGLSSWEVVIEILEAGIGERSDLLEASRYYRSMGCLIAVDDFGAGHSNFDRIWMLRPEIVKLDRMMISQATRNTDLRRVFPEIVSLIRSSGSLALAEGVEVPEEGRMIFETEIDLVQGFLFGLPRTEIGLSSSPALDKAMEGIRSQQSETGENRDLERIVRGLLSVSRELRPENPVLSETMLRSLFGLDPRLIRIFVLDGSGCQIGENLSRSRITDKGDPRFLPLMETRRADWSRRSYFREAIRRPGEVVVSTPYLSTTGAHLCRTLAICVGEENTFRILCLDIDMTGPGR